MERCCSSTCHHEDEAARWQQPSYTSTPSYVAHVSQTARLTEVCFTIRSATTRKATRIQAIGVHLPSCLRCHATDGVNVVL